MRLTNDDFELLATVAEYRVLTKSQAVRLLSRNERALRKRLGQLEEAGHLQVGQTSAPRQGRPEHRIWLTEAGIDLLKEQTRLPAELPVDMVLPGALADSRHHQAQNDFRVALAQLAKALPELTVVFLTDKSPTLRSSAAGLVFAADWLDGRRTDEQSPRLVPDAAFVMKYPPRNKAFLFFLEVDMGTESRASETRPRGDIRHKIREYQQYFRSERYKRYEEAWGCRLHGFRVLFVTSSARRRDSIGGTVRANPPSDFIWLADQAGIAERGLAGMIWRRGGRTDIGETSILGPEVSRQVLEQAARPGDQDSR